MRRLFIILLLGLIASTALVVLIETSPGYVLVSWGRTTVETSVWVGLLLLLLFNLLFYWVLRLWRRLSASGGSFAAWISGRREQRSRRLSEAGMLAFAAGNWQKSRRLLLRAAARTSDPTLAYLACARASNKLQQPDKVGEYLERAAVAAGGH